MLSFFFRSTSTNAYDSFVKGASLTALLLTTSYSDCFDFTLSKVGDGYIDGTAFLFKILMNLTQNQKISMSEMIWANVKRLEVADILPCFGKKIKPFLLHFRIF